MKTINYTKNHRNEIVFAKDAFVSDDNKFVLFIKDGDLTPLCEALIILPERATICLPFLISATHIVAIESILSDNNPTIKIIALDSIGCTLNFINNITPNWSKYIDEDSAVLFLSKEDSKRKYIKNGRFILMNGKESEYKFGFYSNNELRLGFNCLMTEEITKTSIIIPHLDSENLPQINNIAKELKEKYGVERVEVFASHCFGNIEKVKYFDYPNKVYRCNGIRFESTSISYPIEVDKINTTNSTGILEVQDNERLKVVDCVEFFND